MLKFIFWTLLCSNAVLLAYGQGLLGSFKASEREPARITNQFNTDKLALLMQKAGALPAAVAAPDAAPDSAAEPGPASALLACTEIGNFASADARRFDKLLAPLALGERQSQAEVTVQETSSYMVMIPPHASKDAADQKAAQLKEQGVSNFFIINDSSPMKWGISLGVFKSETAAQTLLAALKKQGVTGVKVAGRMTAATKLAYRFRNIDAATKEQLASIAATFTALHTRSCK